MTDQNEYLSKPCHCGELIHVDEAAKCDCGHVCHEDCGRDIAGETWECNVCRLELEAHYADEMEKFMAIEEANHQTNF